MSFFTGLRPTTSGVYVTEPLPNHVVTMPEYFRSNGYSTFSAGKVFHGQFDYAAEAKTDSGEAAWLRMFNKDEYWDELHEYEFEPLPSGRPFNTIFGDLPRSQFPPIYHHFDWGGYDERSLPDALTAAAASEFIKRDHEQPFLCAVGMYKPHLPWFAPKRFFDLYPIDDIVLPVVKDDDLDDVPPIGVEFARAQFDHDRIVKANLWKSATQAYLACVSYCDSLVGEVLDALDSSPHKDNTVVVLLSDNGFHLGQKLHWSKFCLWEEASRVPLLMRLPGLGSRDVTCDGPVSLIDVLPTLAEVCGLADIQPLDGESLLPMVTGTGVPRRTAVITTWLAGNHSVRDGDWRYTRYRDGGEELYDHLTDPFEWHNLAAEPRFASEKAALAQHLDGIESPRLATSNLDPQKKLGREGDVLLAAVERDPGDVGSVFSLAQAYFDSGDFLNARTWYLRRAELGGRDEEVYYSLLRVAESMARLDVPWPQVHDAYLKAWEFRPTRAEPLYAIALRYRLDGRYRLGYLFAKRAADIALPEQDTLVVRADVHAWRAADEQAICASWIGKHAEAFTLCRRLLASAELPDRERQRITRNRDFSVPAMLEAASSYPEGLVDNLIAGPRGAEVTVSVVAGPDLSVTEQTLNSFLHCCTDVSRVGRFLVIDAGLSAQDRATLGQRYGFVEFADPHTELAPIGTRFWLHLGQGWQFFAPEDYITRLTAVLDTEPQVFQVGINFTDATTLTSASAAEQTARRTPDGGRYVLTDVAANGPAMFDTTRLHQAGDVNATTTVPTITDLARHAATTGLHTATLDEILCTTTS